jgi:hypothetical protein
LIYSTGTGRTSRFLFLIMLKLSVFALMVALAAADSGNVCGLKIAPCPEGEVCIPNDPECTDVNRCLGTCEAPTKMLVVKRAATTTYQACGGFVATPTPCPTDYTCIDDPRRGGCGMACDIPGICVPNDSPTCAGFIGKSCPADSGLQCYDYPGDGCDPDDGGADCSGICLFPLK